MKTKYAPCPSTCLLSYHFMADHFACKDSYTFIQNSYLAKASFSYTSWGVSPSLPTEHRSRHGEWARIMVQKAAHTQFPSQQTIFPALFSGTGAFSESCFHAGCPLPSSLLPVLGLWAHKAQPWSLFSFLGFWGTCPYGVSPYLANCLSQFLLLASPNSVYKVQVPQGSALGPHLPPSHAQPRKCIKYCGTSTISSLSLDSCSQPPTWHPHTGPGGTESPAQTQGPP